MDAKFTKGEWKAITQFQLEVNGGHITTQMSGDRFASVSEREANAHLIAAAPDMYKSLERQRKGLINLIGLNLIQESHIESVRHEISLIDNELSRARGE